MPWFDATTVDPATGGGNLPLGVHPAIIKSSAVKPTKDNTGGLLELTVEIIDGAHKGMQGVYRLNLWNANPQSVEIAGKQLSALCHVTNTWHLNAEPKGSELYNKPFKIVVEQQKAPNDQYTQISAVLDIAGNAPVKGQAGAAPQQQPQPGYTPAPAPLPSQAAPAPWGPPPNVAPAAGPVNSPPQAWSQQPPAGANAPWGPR